MENQVETFQNDEVEVSLTRLPGCNIKMEVNAQPTLTSSAWSEATKKISKQVSIPGFRKGKAPANLVQQKYGSHIQQEFGDIVVQRAFSESAKLAETYPLHDRSVKKPKVDKCDKDEGAKVSFEFESHPVVPKLDRESFTINEVVVEEVTDERIDKALEDLSRIYAESTPVEGRPCQEGDVVVLDIVDIGGEESVPLCEDRDFQMKPDYTAKWMRELLEGKSIGDSVEGTSKYEEGSELKEEEFKPTEVKITLKGIKELKAPEIGEPLAEAIGVGSFDELKEKVREDIVNRTKEEGKESVREHLAEQILEQHQFDVPGSLLASEQKTVMKNLMIAMKQDGYTDEKILEEKDEIQNRASDRADKGLRLFFLAREMAPDWRIELSQAEVTREMSRQMFQVPINERVIDSEQEPEEMRSQVYIHLLSRKMLDIMIEKSAQKSVENA